MRRCHTVIVIALLGSVPVIAAVLVMRLVLPIGQSQAGVPAQQAAPVVEEKAELVLVLAAAQFLPVGTLLADEHLTEVGIEEHLVVRGHIEVEGPDPDEMPYGHAVREAIEAGRAADTAFPGGAPAEGVSGHGPEARHAGRHGRGCQGSHAPFQSGGSGGRGPDRALARAR